MTRPGPDVRFVLANERTLLAWIRTALALLAGGGGLQQFGTDVKGHSVLAVLLALAGIAAALMGAARYLRVMHALEHGQPSRPGRAPVVLAIAVAAVGVALLVAIAATR